MSHSTHYKSFRGWFLQTRWPNQQCQSTRKPVGRRDQSWIPPELLHHVIRIHI